jgi:hypothetical protein
MDCTCDRSSLEVWKKPPYLTFVGGLIPVFLGPFWSFQLPTAFCRTVEDYIQCGPIHSLDFEMSTLFAL